jgi:uncharacterized protein (TIGR03118 family)
MATAQFEKSLAAIVVTVGALCLGATRAGADTFVQTNLVSDISGLAKITDPNLMNPWGVSETGMSPFWSSNQVTNTATLYTVTGSTNVSKVNINAPKGFVGIPTTASGPQGPTGQVANTNTSSFPVGNGGDGGSAHFIFSNLNGTISAWDTQPSNAFVQATTPGALYTGLAVNSAQNRLYAANNAATGGISVFDSGFHPVNLGSGAFVDQTLPTGFVPFNVQDINGKVYVTYAPAGRTNQINATPGMGFVNVFDEDGHFLQRLSGGPGTQLAAPWGMALAPLSFGQFGGDLLIGNRSSVASGINAFDPNTGAFKGTILIDIGSNTGAALWALIFGNGAAGGDPNTLYFSDGLNGEVNGLFASIQAIPIPAALPLFASGLGGLGLLAWRRKRKAVS